MWNNLSLFRYSETKINTYVTVMRNITKKINNNHRLGIHINVAKRFYTNCYYKYILLYIYM